MDLHYLFRQPPIYEVLRLHLRDSEMVLLRYVLREIKPVKTPQLVALAAHGDLRLVKWAFGQWFDAKPCAGKGKCRNCSQLPGKAAEAAAKFGTPEVVLWWIARNKRIAYTLFKTAVRHGRLATVKCLYLGMLGRFKAAEIMEDAAHSGSVELIEWLVEYGHNVTESIIAIAAGQGHVQMLEWALLRGVEIPWHVAEDAAKAGHICVLEWIHQHGRLTSDVMAFAAGAKRIDVLEWMCERGYTPCGKVILRAVSFRHFDVVEWVLERGVEWPHDIDCFAINLNAKVLEWALDHGAPWWSSAYSYAVANGYSDILEVIERRGLAP
jgi:hypothetical protein